MFQKSETNLHERIHAILLQEVFTPVTPRAIAVAAFDASAAFQEDL
jgi:hypothetical protein